jgi:hypothetical protein
MIQKVVRIDRGEIIDAYITDGPYPQVYKPRNLTKKGVPDDRKGSDGPLYQGQGSNSIFMGYWVLYDAAQEERAAPLRAEIERLHAASSEAQQKLLDLYRMEAS